MTFVHQSHQTITNIVSNRTNADKNQLPESRSQYQSNPACDILARNAKTQNKTKNSSARILSNKEQAIMHQLETADKKATKRIKRAIKHNKIQEDPPDVNTVSAKD